MKSQLVAEEFFISQKFKDFVAEFLPEEFWEGDELYPPNVLIEKIEKVRLRTFGSQRS